MFPQRLKQWVNKSIQMYINHPHRSLAASVTPPQNALSFDWLSWEPILSWVQTPQRYWTNLWSAEGWRELEKSAGKESCKNQEYTGSIHPFNHPSMHSTIYLCIHLRMQQSLPPSVRWGRVRSLQTEWVGSERCASSSALWSLPPAPSADSELGAPRLDDTLLSPGTHRENSHFYHHRSNQLDSRGSNMTV